MGLSLFLTIICGFGVLYNAVEGYYSRNTFDYKETPFSRIIAYNYAQETIDYIDGWTNSYDVQSRLENNSTNANIIVYDEDDNQIYNNRQRIGSNVSEFMFNFVSHSQNYYVKVTIPRDIKIEDDFYFTSILLENTYRYRNLEILGCIVFFILFLMQLIYFIKKGDNYDEEGKIQCSKLNCVPIDFLSAVIAGVDICILIVFLEMMYNVPFQSGKFHVLFVLALFWLVYYVNIYYFYSVYVQIRNRILIKNSLIIQIAHFLFEKSKILFENYKIGLNKIIGMIPLVWKVIVSIAFVFFFNLFCIFMILIGNDFFVIVFLILWILVDLSILVFLCKQSLDWLKLKDTAKQLAQGDLNQQMDTSDMIMDIKEFGENLNQIKIGLNEEVEKRMKSELLKTELVTNVSHDLKTPLTSIINYIDLLKKEESEEKRKEYIEILERHSLRLKKLTEDLIEASKASTGNVKVNLITTNLCEMITQTTAEFADRFDKNQLSLEVNSSNNDLHILADGKLLYRIFDNILSNACKYSLPQTRVYMDVIESDKTVELAIKNISKERLNINAEDLMERFVRGDSSRNTEGSGLGLSIAKSLTELLGGTMNIIIDGDLFKVILKFNKVEE